MAFAGLVLAVLLVSLGSRGPAVAPSDAPVGAVYRAGGGSLDTTPPDAGPSVVVLGGTLRQDTPRTRALEALMRLHLWLALRDVHPTGPTLRWVPATTGSPTDDPVARLCLPRDLPAERTLGRDDPPLLGPALRPRGERRVFIVASTEIGVARYEVHVCAPGSRGSSQVFVSEVGREGPAMREILAWLTGVLGAPEVEPWFATWSRPLAPDVVSLRAFGETLAASMEDGGGQTDALIDAASLLPEAAWVASALSEADLDRRRLLERAASLRPGFTAALEDLAWEWTRAARPDLALLTLSRLRAPERVRPSELLLAARMLEEEAYADAAGLIDQLPPRWKGTTAARRLEALAHLGAGDPERTQQAARRWTEADPGAAEGWLLQGTAARLLDQPVEAEAAYREALAEPSRQRGEVLTRWAALLLDLGRGDEVVEALTDEDDDALVQRTPRLLALRAWAHWSAGNATRAAADTRRLAALEPERAEHRRNLCVIALSAGTTEAPPSECGEPAFGDLFGTLFEAVWLSRRPFRTPEEGGLLDRRVAELAEAAPLAAPAAGAALRVLGPRAEDEALEALQARWQLARGVELEAARSGAWSGLADRGP